MSIYEVFNNSSNSFNKEEWAAEKQAQRKAVYDLIDGTCTEMLSSGEAFRQYLEVQGRFDRYSVANAILVSAQMPEATQLMEYGKWKQNHVYVDRDAKKVTVLEPGKEYTRDDGTKAVSYNVKVVYDISQTSARNRQKAPEPKNMRELVSALLEASPVPFQLVDRMEMPAFYDGERQEILVRTDLTETGLFVGMAKEIAAAIYDFKMGENRNESSFKSSCVAYMISSRYGVDIGDIRSDRLPRDFYEMDTQAFREQLGSMRDIFIEIQRDMNKSLEQNKAAKNKEQSR